MGRGGDDDDDAMMLLELEEDDDRKSIVSKAAQPGLKPSSKRSRKAAPVPINYTYSDYKGGDVS